MTEMELNLNELNTVMHDKRPLRVIPVEELFADSGRSGDWHGWSYTVYRTKTGKILAGFVSWSAVQGERDYLNTYLADDIAGLYAQLDPENYVHRKLALEIASKHEVIATV